MRAQLEIFGHVLHYQALALKPMIFILPPLVLVMVQLHQFYGFRGLQPGDSVLLTVQLDQEAVEPGRRPAISLETPAGLRAETAAVWVPSLAQISWRIGVDKPGDYEFLIGIDNTEVTKRVRATDRIERLSPERPPRTFIGQLEWPSEKPLDRDGPVHSITLAYPDATVSILGWDIEWQWAWMVVFFVLTMVVALVLRKPMGVEL
jgi:hypothetical protein